MILGANSYAQSVSYWPTATEQGEYGAKRLYPVLTSIQAILLTVSPHSRRARRLLDLIEAHRNLALRGVGLCPDGRTTRSGTASPSTPEAAGATTS